MAGAECHESRRRPRAPVPMVLAHKRQKRQHNPPFTYVDIDPESVGQDLPDPYAFLPKVDDFGLAPRHTVELLRPGRGDSAPSPKTPGTPRGGGLDTWARARRARRLG